MRNSEVVLITVRATGGGLYDLDFFRSEPDPRVLTWRDATASTVETALRRIVGETIAAVGEDRS